MCLQGSASSVDQYAKKVNLKDIARGRQPPATILAWRTWKLEGSASLAPSLKSENQATIWTPGKPVDAHNKITLGGDKIGVHAYKTIEELLAGGYVNSTNKASFTQRTVVIGQVLLWGMIATHSNGYRAEHGYPFKIYVNGPSLQVRLAEIYGCLFGRDFIPRLLKAA